MGVPVPSGTPTAMDVLVRELNPAPVPGLFACRVALAPGLAACPRVPGSRGADVRGLRWTADAGSTARGGVLLGGMAFQAVAPGPPAVQAGGPGVEWSREGQVPRIPGHLAGRTGQRTAGGDRGRGHLQQ